jgi:regulator of replication initiation timing
MTANFQIKNSTSSANFSRPSVPLSVYRELVKELETTQAQTESLVIENQQLFQQNQQLRQEIETVIRYAQHLQEVIASQNTISVNPPVSPPQAKPSASNKYKERVIEIESDRSRYVSPSSNDSTINGWVLAIALILIVVTSCLGAFLIVNSRLHNR